MKKFITIALAVAVLFSFAACQQAYKVPTGLSVSTTRTGYLVGEQIDLSTVTGTLEYSDGSTRTISGAELSAPQGLDVDSTTTEISFVYGGNGGVGATLLINVYNYSDIEKISVTELPSTTSEVNAGTMFRIPASATLPDGSVASVEVFIGADTSGKKVGDVVKATPASVGIGDFTRPTWITGVELEGFDNWNITIVAADNVFDSTTVQPDLVIEYNDNETIYVDETITYKVYAVDANGNRDELTKDTDYKVMDGATLPASFAAAQTAGTETYRIYYVADPTVTGTIQAPAGVAYVESVTFKAKADVELPASGGTLSVAQLTTYYDIEVKAHGTATFTPSDENMVITNGVWKENKGTGTTVFTPTAMIYGLNNSKTWKDAGLTQLTVAAPAN